MTAPSDIQPRPSKTPSRSPSQTPTRSGRGSSRKGPPREPLPPGTLLCGGAFRILEVLGQGGFSITYMGLEGTRQVKVAIKELFPLGCVRSDLQVAPAHHWDERGLESARQDFVAEGKVLKFFTHPGIVQSFSPFQENGTAYLAMEYLEGESLLEGLQRRGPMNQTQALEVARQVGGALAYVHERDIVHSDIKPENIIYTTDSRFVILDFGVSRRNVPGRPARAAVVAVSPPYSPPEQYYASRALTRATDIYSLSATLYTMLACTLPPDAVARSKGSQLIPLTELNPSVTPSFWKILQAGLEMKPENRPQSLEDFLYFLSDSTPSAAPSSTALPDTERGLEKIGEFEAHRGGVRSLALHPTRPLLLSGARNGAVGLWSWPAGECMGNLKAHDTPLAGFALSPDGHLLATAGEPGEIKLWRTEDAQLLKQLHNGLPPVSSLAFAHDSQTVAAGMSDGTVYFYSPQRTDPLIVRCHSGAIETLAFAPNGLMLATAGQDGRIKLWDMATLGLLRTLEGHSKGVLQVAFSPDSRLLVSGASDYTTRLWDVDAGLELRRFREEGANHRSVSFACDAELLVTANSDKKLRLYRWSTGRLLDSVEADKNYLRSVVCDAQHPLLASAGGDGFIRLWRFRKT